MSDLCPHFGDCGGCKSQDVPYEEQLARKSDALRKLFAAYWDGPIPVAPSPQIWNYRNKVDFSFSRKFYPEPPPKDFERESVLGFKSKAGWFRPLEISECRIAPEGMTPLLASVREWMSSQHLDAFDSRKRKGFLRALLAREGKRTGQRLIGLITSDGDFDKEGFVKAIMDSYPAASIHRGIFRGLADVTAADESELLHGAPTIEEKLLVPRNEGPLELRFRLSPFSFFQTNTLGAEILYGKIRAWLKNAAPKILYDLYGGAGGIAFTCADLVNEVFSVENVASATEDGIHNAAVNGIENVRFTTAKVETYLKPLLESGPFPPRTAVVTDPPRAGMHPKALRRLVELRPDNLLYVSCKPSVLATELPTLLETHRLASMYAVDMFPHTEHVELLAGLERIP
jgi:23S rRNA (uracil1939-C5)-methyltransferase